MKQLILRPHPEPFDFIAKWSQPIWNQGGIYLWSIRHQNGYLVSYVGQTTFFSRRIWDQEYKRWKKGLDVHVDIDQWKAGRRIELHNSPAGHIQREIKELTPLIRLWLIPLNVVEEYTPAEHWLVHRLCQAEMTRQFLSNKNPHSYRPDPMWDVQIDAPPQFQVFGLTVSIPTA